MSAISAFKPLSMADGCLASLPAVLTTNKAQCPFRLSARALRLDSVKANFLTLPLKNEKKYAVNFVVRTSEWAQAAQVEEEELVFGQEQVAEARISDWEGENEAEPEGGDVEESGEEGGFDEEESYQDPPEDAKLFVGNLPYDVDSEQLAQIFDKAGIVEVAEVIYNRETDQSRGFGFVTMSTVEEAEKAVQLFHRYDINGRLLTVNKASPRGSRTERVPREFEPSFRIYVGNLPWQVDDARLEQVFSEHGKVVDARVVSDRETGRSRGFGFVTMSSKDEIDDAIAALDGQILDGRALRVNVAEQRPRRI